MSLTPPHNTHDTFDLDCVDMQVLGSSYTKELLELIPADNLPVRFGGNSSCDETQDVGPWESTLFDRQAAANSCEEGTKKLQATGSATKLVAHITATSCTDSPTKSAPNGLVKSGSKMSRAGSDQIGTAVVAVDGEEVSNGGVFGGCLPGLHGWPGLTAAKSSRGMSTRATAGSSLTNQGDEATPGTEYVTPASSMSTQPTAIPT